MRGACLYCAVHKNRPTNQYRVPYDSHSHIVRAVPDNLQRSVQDSVHYGHRGSL